MPEAPKRSETRAMTGIVLALVGLLSVRGVFEPRLPDGVLVEVVGDVDRPGVHLVPPRVAAALEAAGGRADSDGPLADGDRVVVRGARVEVVPAHDPWLLGAPVDLNEAGADALMTLPQVGPATAAAILDFRRRYGPFYEVSEVTWVRGIGPATRDALAPVATVADRGPRPPAPPLDLDRATAGQLERLPGIGPTRAAAIVAEREAHGPFGDLRGLERVPGIGPRTVARLADHVTAGGGPR